MAVTLIIIILNTLPFSIPIRGSAELKREILEDLISVDKPELFDEYGELYLAKEKSQAVIQGMEGWQVTTNTKEWVDLLLELIADFEEMVELSKSSAPSDHLEALAIAESINSTLIKISHYETAKENEIPMLAEPALKRFYRSEGIFFENLSRNEQETRVKIEYEKISSSSYKEGGLYTIRDASRMEFEARKDEWIYTRDMDRASEYLNATRLHLEHARNPASGFFGSALMEIIKAKDSFEAATSIYAKHKDRELQNVAGIQADIRAVYLKLMLETLKVIGIYLLILSFFTFIIWRDFNRWSGDLDDTRLGEELIV
ncbi:MAG: hypothetical protein EFT35_02125 [Methanophagales archaeon ANME-1-THS]|nr:MAG: hypothetical protein EFT35_02125 [Methanophagales archaeon ANME-1-THS]